MAVQAHPDKAGIESIIASTTKSLKDIISLCIVQCPYFLHWLTSLDSVFWEIMLRNIRIKMLSMGISLILIGEEHKEDRIEGIEEIRMWSIEPKAKMQRRLHQLILQQLLLLEMEKMVPERNEDL
jgi:hypothetical protein